MSEEAEGVQLSVVIAGHDVCRVIGPCLTALRAQGRRASIEVIYADSSTDGSADIVADVFSWVRLLRCESTLGLPQLRARAIACARAPIIAMLDPYSIVDADWARAVIDAHETLPHPIIGGLVDLYESHNRGLTEWTLYFNEYGRFLPPAARGPVPLVPGCNVSYKRAVLFDGDRPRHSEFWKTFVNDDAAQQGRHPLWLEPSIVVALNKPIGFLPFLKTRYLHGRCYAGMRARDESAVLRVARAALAPAVAIVLQARWARDIWPKRRARGMFIATLPLQFALFVSWAYGEFWGCALGPGCSCNQLYY